MEVYDFKGIEIIRTLPVNLNEPKGNTYELWKNNQMKQITVYERKKGHVSGNHYHKGDDPSKNPEIFFLAHGKAVLKARNPQNQNLQLMISPGTELRIYPNVLHAIYPIDNVIIFLEARQTIFNAQKHDTYEAKTYDEYIRNTCLAN